MDAQSTNTPPERKTVNPIAPSFDLRKVRCDAESALQSAIRKNEDFNKRLQARSEGRQAAFVDGRLSLIKNSYGVDAALSPKLSQLRDMLRTTLRLVQPIDLYVQADPTLNAFCLPSRKGTRFVMCLNSALVNGLTPHELMFVMGHEVGHAVLGHGQIPNIEFGDPDFSLLEVVHTRALSRRQEISCDRIGLLACQSVAVAGSALLKIMSGLSDHWVRFDTEAFLRQFDQIADLAEVTQMDDASSTHPIIGLRGKALKSFADSQLFAEALGRTGGRIAVQDLERETQHLLSVLEPDLTELESGSEQEAATSLLINGALAVAVADGTLDNQEVAYLKTKMKLTEQAAAALHRPDFQEVAMKEIAEAATVLRRKLNPRDRVGLLHELCRVALAAGGYAEGEERILAQIGQLLDVPEVVFQQVVSNANPPESKPMEVPDTAKPRRRRRKPSATPREAAPSSGTPDAQGEVGE